MPRATSLSFRRAAHAQSTESTPVVLVTITHEDLTEPVYLSSDPTVRISEEPLIYGTVSDGNEFLFVLMGAIVPDDQADTSPKTSLVFEMVTSDMAKPFDNIRSPVTVDLMVVLAETPDSIEAAFYGLMGTKITYNQSQLTMEISREPYTSEPWPSGRMTRARFPGLFR